MDFKKKKKEGRTRGGLITGLLAIMRRGWVGEKRDLGPIDPTCSSRPIRSKRSKLSNICTWSRDPSSLIELRVKLVNALEGRAYSVLRPQASGGKDREEGQNDPAVQSINLSSFSSRV